MSSKVIGTGAGRSDAEKVTSSPLYLAALPGRLVRLLFPVRGFVAPIESSSSSFGAINAENTATLCAERVEPSEIHAREMREIRLGSLSARARACVFILCDR